jgi:thioredoxin 1
LLDRIDNLGEIFVMKDRKVSAPAATETIRQANQPNAQSTGRTIRLAAAALLAAMAICAGGCSTKDVLQIKDKSQFHQVMDDSNQPVLMFYYKDGCALCAALEPVVNELAKEYQGRVTTARYGLMTFTFIPRSREIMNKYDISFFPTVVLYVKGKEYARWVSQSNLEKYRPALNKAAPPPATQPASGSQPASATHPAPSTRGH